MLEYVRRSNTVSTKMPRDLSDASTSRHLSLTTFRQALPLESNKSTTTWRTQHSGLHSEKSSSPGIRILPKECLSMVTPCESFLIGICGIHRRDRGGIKGNEPEKEKYLELRKPVGSSKLDPLHPT